MTTAQALSLALIHFLWQGALIALSLAAVLAFAQNARTRYALACLAMATMPVAFAVSLVSALNGASAAPPGLVEVVVAPGLPWLPTAWIAGVVLVGLYRLGGWIAAQDLKRRAVQPAPLEWRTRLAVLAERAGVTQAVALLESGLAQTPVVIGSLRPAILTPVGMLASLPAHQVEAILLHELAHIQRSDYLVNLMQTLVESILFYHPAVWWVSRLIRIEREHCCDDQVVALGSDAREYVEALLAIEENRHAAQVPAMAATGGDLMHRIHRLLDPSKQPRAGAASWLSAGLLVLVFSMLAGAQQQSQALSATFLNWLNQDVVYIIDDREKAAFEKLATDEERSHFIEQFWARRDTNRETPENEAKKEHYRRIEYANDRFADAVEAGWQSDKGRLYIVHGPPDEIESHPRRGVEYWLYRATGQPEMLAVFRQPNPGQDGPWVLSQPLAPAKRPLP